ncbi:break repair meiotic recombinase recruitment factor 1 [Thomomys bottae]
MSKRKKPQISEEETHPLRLPKSPRLGDSSQELQSYKLDHFCHPEVSENGSGPPVSAELSCSSPDVTVFGPLEQLEKEPYLPPSQCSVRRFVPQFARARKTVARNVEAKVSPPSKCRLGWLKTLPKPGSQPAGTQLLGEPPELHLQQAGGPGQQTQAEDLCSEQSGQQPMIPVPGSDDFLPDICPRVGLGPWDLEKASLHPLSEPESNHMRETQRPQVPGDEEQNEHLPGRDDEEEGLEGGVPQDGAEAGPPGVEQEAGDIRGSPVVSTPVLGSAPGLRPPPPHTETPLMAQGLPKPWQGHSETGGETDQSCALASSTLETLLITRLSPDPGALELGTPQEAGPPASPDTQAPDPDISWALLGSMPLPEEAMGGRGFPEEATGGGGFPEEATGGEGFLTEATGGGGFPEEATGGGGFPIEATGGEGFLTEATGGGGFPIEATGGEGFLTEATGDRGFPIEATGGEGFLTEATGGGGFPEEATGGGGFPIEATGGEGFLTEATGGGGFPEEATGGGGFPIEATGGEGFLTEATGGGGFPEEATGGGGFPIEATGGEGFLTEATGDRGFPIEATGGEGFLTEATGGGGFPTEAMGGEGFPTEAMGGGGFPEEATGGGGFPTEAMGGGGFPEEATGGGGEAEMEEQPSEASVLGNPEPTVGPGDPGLVILEVDPGVVDALSALAQPVPREPLKSSSQHQQDLGELHLSPKISSLLDETDTADGPLQETTACPGGTDAPTDQPEPSQLSQGSASQASWPESPTMELDFLLDSQIQDALDANDVELPAGQGFPAGTAAGLPGPGPSPCATLGDPVTTEAQPRPVGGPQVPETLMEDATDTVRGLVVELSNLNRLIMSTHRDLEACKRLSLRKGKTPHKGPGGLPCGQQAWGTL